MPFYRPIKDIKPKKTRRRMITGPETLRMQMDEEMPHKTKESTLILGTWNIRNFDDNRFYFSTVHIYYGEASGSKFRRRVDEIERVAKFLAKRAKDDYRNHILVGDFNIVQPGSPGHNALEKHGFVIYQNKEGSTKTLTDKVSKYQNQPGKIN